MLPGVGVAAACCFGAKQLTARLVSRRDMMEQMPAFFGEDDPCKLPGHFFYGALHIDYATAVRADISKQDYTVCPRHWYVDAAFRCPRCQQTFVFAAEEQRFWFEQLRFYVDTQAKHCPACRKERRELRDLKKAYDAGIAAALGGKDMQQKSQLLAVLDALEEGGVALPAKMVENRRLLQRQIDR